MRIHRRALVGLVLLVALVGAVVIRLGTAGADPGLRTVAVGTNPQAVAVDAHSHHVFVATYNGSVSVLDAYSGAILRRIALATSTIGGSLTLVVDARTRRVFVVGDNGVVTMVDVDTGGVLRAVHVAAPTLPRRAVGLDEQAGRLVIVGRRGTVSVLDARTGKIVRAVAVTTPAQGLALALDTRTGYAFVGGDAGVMSILDTGTGKIVHTSRILTPFSSFIRVAVAQTSRRVFLANEADFSVSMFDARTGLLLRTVPVAAFPVDLAVDEHTGHVFVLSQGNGGHGTVSMLNARSGAVLATTYVGGAPIALAVDERSGRAFVTGAGDGADRKAGVQPVDGMYAWLAHTSATWLTHQDTGHVTVLDTRSDAVLRIVAVGQGPSAVAVDAGAGRVVVANFNGGSVSLLDATR